MGNRFSALCYQNLEEVTISPVTEGRNQDFFSPVRKGKLSLAMEDSFSPEQQVNIPNTSVTIEKLNRYEADPCDRLSDILLFLKKQNFLYIYINIVSRNSNHLANYFQSSFKHK